MRRVGLPRLFFFKVFFKVCPCSSETPCMLSKVKGFLLPFFLLVWGVSPALGAPEVPVSNVESARTFLADLIQLSDLSRAKQGQQDEASRLLMATLSGRIDFTALATRSLGRARWPKLKERERKDFLALLQELLEEVVYPQARKINSAVESLSFRAEGKDRVLIEGTVEREKKGEVVSTDLKVALIYDAKSRKIIDAVLEKEQISSNLKRQFDAALKKQTFGEILAKMKKRVQQAKAGDKKAP